MDIPVTIGEKLLITKNKKSKKQYSMVSQVLGGCHGGILTIAMPMLRGKLVPLWPGGVIDILFYKENGIYEFKGRVISRSGGRIPSLKVRVIPPLKKSQRRDYYRLSTILPVLLHVDCSTENGKKTIKCCTLDLSAGGMRLASDKDLEKGCIVFCSLVLEGKLFSIKAKVVRSNAVYNKEYNYEIGIQFLGLNEKMRSEIIGYIFKEQSKLKRKGLI